MTASSESAAVARPVYISGVTLQYLLDGMRLGSVFVSLEPTMDSPVALYPSSEIERLSCRQIAVSEAPASSMAPGAISGGRAWLRRAHP